MEVDGGRLGFGFGILKMEFERVWVEMDLGMVGWGEFVLNLKIWNGLNF